MKKVFIRMLWVIAFITFGLIGTHQVIYASEVTPPAPTPVPVEYYFEFNSSPVASGEEVEIFAINTNALIKSNVGIANDADVKWVTSSPNVIDIKANIAGKQFVTLERKGPGYATITAVITENGYSYTISCQVKVMLDIDYNRTQFVEATTTKEKVVIIDKVGDTKPIYLKYSNSDDTNPVMDKTSISWESTNPFVATVDELGNVKAVGGGSAIISATTTTVSNQNIPQKKEVIVVVKPEEHHDFDANNAPSDFIIHSNATYATDLIWKVTDRSNKVISASGDIRLQYSISSKNGSIEINNAKAGMYKIYGFASKSYDENTKAIPYIELTVVVPIRMTRNNIVMNVHDTFNLLENTNIPSMEVFGYKYSNDDSSIAQLNPSTGVIKGLAKGNVTITLIYNKDSNIYDLADPQPDIPFSITVIDGIALSMTTATIYTSSTITLEALTTDPSKKVTWVSEDPSIASVNDGTVTGNKVGTTKIIASQTINGVTKTSVCIMNVIQSVTKITIDPADVMLNIGDYKTLYAKVEPKELSQVSLKWISSNDTVVKITDPGKIVATIQGVSGGTAVISAINQDNIVVGSCLVIVKQKVTSISLSDTSVSIPLSAGSFQIRATVLPENATNKKITWRSTNTSIVAVDENGKVSLKSSGIASIIATSLDDPSVTAFCNITVEVPVASVALEETTKTMYVGESTRIPYIINPTNATNRAVTWSSSNTTVVTVDASGLLTARATGQAIIMIRTVDGGILKTCTVTVKQNATGIKLDVSDIEINVGQTYDIKVSLTPEGSSDVQLSFVTTDSKVATVDQSGKLTGVSEGKAVILIKLPSGVSVYCNVTVIQQIQGIQLNYEEKTVVIGESFDIKATVIPSSAFGIGFKWSSSKPSVAKVSDKGTVTAIKGGTTIITCETVDGKFTKICVVTVVERVTSIKLNKSSYKLPLGKSYTLKATVETNAATDPTIEWVSSDNRIASVDSKGKITGKKLGYATITAKALDGSRVEAICEVRVVKPVTSIKLNRTSVNTIEGRSFTLQATVKPSNATYKNVKWSSSDESIAIVDSDGEVIALKGGNVVITATAKDNSGKSASCLVFVQPRTPATSVTILNQNLTMVVGETITLQKTINPTTSTDRYTWDSDNKQVVSVDGATGRIKANTPGIASVTIMTESGKKATTKVTVVGLNTNKLVLEQYSKYRLSVIGISSGVTWDIDDPEIAEVRFGQVITKKIGSTTITATVNGRRLTCSLKVNKIG